MISDDVIAAFQVSRRGLKAMTFVVGLCSSEFWNQIIFILNAKSKTDKKIKSPKSTKDNGKAKHLSTD